LFGREGALEGAIQQQLEAACARGGSSMYITGINPGWVNSIVVALTAVCRRVDKVTIFESADCSHYASLETWLAHGISQPKSTPAMIENTRKSLLPFGDTIRRMAEALEIKLEELNYDRYHIRIDGDPGVETRVRFIPPVNWVPTDWSILTALPAVSCVPAVHAARPGLLTLWDVGLPHAPVGVWK
jgi:hypothetical protein